MSIRSYLDFTPDIAPTAYIDEQATVIGKVCLGEHCSIWPQTVLRGDVNTISIGAYSNIQDGSIVHVTRHRIAEDGVADEQAGFPCQVGRYVTVGHGVMLHGCVIHDHCLIGIGAVVLDGAVVEQHVVLGAGSLVPPGKTLQSGWLYMGSPAKPIRKLSEKEIALFEQSAKNYAQLKENYL